MMPNYGGMPNMGGFRPGPGGLIFDRQSYQPQQNTTLGAYQKQLDTAPQDYSSIMQGFGSQVGRSAFDNPNVQTGLGTLSDISQTGGYSPADIASIRERATSPIRSIYANAQADINRQRNLQGGYSPNYTAATAKMARDQSQQISDTTGNINAQLAQNIIGNRMGAAQPLASTSGSLASGDLARALQAFGGQASLFGTGPGMLNTLGNQVLQAQGLSDQQQRFIDQLNQQGQMSELSALIRGMA